MKHLRDHFPILKEYTYLNTARFSAQHDRIIQEQKAFLDHLQHHGSWHFDDWATGYETTRSVAAHLIGAQPHKVFFLPNVSTGINLAAAYLPKLPVLGLKGDFPTVNIPWEPHGFDVTLLDHTAPDFYEKLTNQLTGSPKIIAMSWILAVDGFELNLDVIYKLAKGHGHILILDATQGVGAIPFQVDPEIACMTLVSGFKWTLAGYGIAIGYLSDSLMNRFEAVRGWNSLGADGRLKKGAMQLEAGNVPFVNAVALQAGLQLLDEIGIPAICDHNRSLKNHLIAKLEDAGRAFVKNESRSAILSLEASAADFARLEKNRIQVTKQAGKIRISPNFYNETADLDRFLHVLLEA